MDKYFASKVTLEGIFKIMQGACITTLQMMHYLKGGKEAEQEPEKSIESIVNEICDKNRKE